MTIDYSAETYPRDVREKEWLTKWNNNYFIGTLKKKASNYNNTPEERHEWETLISTVLPEILLTIPENVLLLVKNVANARNSLSHFGLSDELIDYDLLKDYLCDRCKEMEDILDNNTAIKYQPEAKLQDIIPDYKYQNTEDIFENDLDFIVQELAKIINGSGHFRNRY